MSDTAVRKPKTKVDPNETPEQRYIRLAESRGEKLIHQMKLLKNLGKSYAYKIDSELAEELLVKFDESLDALKAQWQTAIQKEHERRIAEEAEESKDSEPVSSPSD